MQGEAETSSKTVSQVLCALARQKRAAEPPADRLRGGWAH